MIFLKRIAVVIWWFGLLSFVFAIYSAGSSYFRSRGCASVFAEEQALLIEAQKLTKSNLEKLPAMPTNSKTKPVDALVEYIEARSHGLDNRVIPENVDRPISEIWEHVVSINDLPRSKTFDAQLERCKMAQESRDSGIQDGLLIGVIFWVLAYILGGAFYRPPRIKD